MYMSRWSVKTVNTEENNIAKDWRKHGLPVFIIKRTVSG